MPDFFAREGYCIADNVFTEQECKLLIEASNSFLESQASDEKYKPLMNPDRENETIASAVRHKALVALVEVLLGSRIEAVQTQFFWKPPGALGHDPHQDNFYVQSTYDGFVAAWVALENAGIDNGGIVVYPGSHKEPILPVQEVDVPATDRPLYPNQRGLAAVVPGKYKELPLHIAQGSVLFFHGHIAHRSLDNTGNRFRRALVIDYVREGAPFATGRHANRKRINVYSGRLSGESISN